MEERSSKKSKKNLCWDDWHDETLVSVMVNQVKNGGRVNGIFTASAWDKIEGEISRKLGVEYTREKMNSRIRTLKKDYRIMRIMKDQEGWGWNESKKVVEVDDEAWDLFVAAHKEATKFRYKPFKMYEKMHAIWGDNASALQYATSTSEDQDADDVNYLNDVNDMNDVHDDLYRLHYATDNNNNDTFEHTRDHDDSSHPEMPSSASISMQGGGIRIKVDLLIDDATIKRFMKLEERKKNHAKEHNSPTTVEKVLQSDESMKKPDKDDKMKSCMDILETMSLPPEDYIAAATLLMEEKIASMFLMVNETIRPAWLQSIICERRAGKYALSEHFETDETEHRL